MRPTSQAASGNTTQRRVDWSLTPRNQRIWPPSIEMLILSSSCSLVIGVKYVRHDKSSLHKQLSQRGKTTRYWDFFNWDKRSKSFYCTRLKCHPLLRVAWLHVLSSRLAWFWFREGNYVPSETLAARCKVDVTNMATNSRRISRGSISPGELLVRVRRVRNCVCSSPPGLLSRRILAGCWERKRERERAEA